MEIITIINKLDWSFITSSLLVIIGWGITYYFANKQISKVRQKEVITNYLIEAYRNVEEVCGRDSLSDAQKRNVEKSVADIQLFGTLKQIKLAKDFTEEMNKSQYSDPRKLLIILRNDLRDELNIELASTNSSDIIHWRLK